MPRLAAFILLFLATGMPLSRSAEAADPGKFYFWVAPATEGDYTRDKHVEEGFVVEVNARTATRIRNFVAAGNHTGVSGRIAAGNVDYNRNYFLPGHPVWNWHFTSIDRVDPLPICINFCEQEPFAASRPSDIAKDPNQWIASYGDHYQPAYYEVKGEIHPDNADAFANVSNRGFTGAGEKTLITGLIIKGGQPRNVVLRALGPTLTTAGVQSPAMNPKIEVYDSSGSQIAVNTDWKTDSRSGALASDYPVLAPSDDKEAALLLTLLPGAYTLHGINEDGTEGVVVLEAYDVDNVSQ